MRGEPEAARHRDDRPLPDPPLRRRPCRSRRPSPRWTTSCAPGKVRYIGASSGYAWQMAQALSTSERNGWARFVSMQNHYNLLYREEEREMIPLCIQEGIGIIPWSPLARGFLARPRKASEAKSTDRAREPTPTPTRSTPASSTGPWWTPWSASRRRAAPAWRRWRWRGCSHAPASPPRSSAPARSHSSTTRSPPWSSSSRPRRSRRSTSTTRRTRCGRGDRGARRALHAAQGARALRAVGH